MRFVIAQIDMMRYDVEDLRKWKAILLSKGASIHEPLDQCVYVIDVDDVDDLPEGILSLMTPLLPGEQS